MAFTHKISSNKLTFIIVFVAFMSTLKADVDLVEVVCDRKIRPNNFDAEYCKKALRSDPNWGIADIADLALIGIGLAQKHTTAAIDLLENLKLGAKSPEVLGMYNSCLRNYETAKNELLNSIPDFNQKNYIKTDQRAQAANDASNVCDDNFVRIPEPLLLNTVASELRTLCSTISYVAQKLQESEYQRISN